ARLQQQWERFGLTDWNFGNLPEQVSSETESDRVIGWPGLKVEEGHIHLRLFRSREMARRESLPGICSLIELAVQKDLAWLQKDLRALVSLQPVLAELCTMEELQAGAFANAKLHLLAVEPFPRLAEAHFRHALEEARRRLPGLATQLGDRIEAVLKPRYEI